MSQTLTTLVAQRFAAAISQACGLVVDPADTQVRASADAKFGDYQCNAAMALAKKLGKKPHDVAKSIIAAAQLDDIAAPPEVAGPGFINVRLKSEFIGEWLARIPAAPGDVQSDRVGLTPVASPQRVVIDYSSPNIAKSMHVGHLRSSIIGDSLARVLAFEGHTVIRQNHVGDWGTQFGMVILAMWHICMSHLRGEPDAVPRWLGELEQSATDAAATVAVVQRVYQQHVADLRGDEGGDRFKAWLDANSATIDLAALETGYRFVNALEKAAEPLALSIAVPNPEASDPRETPYHRLSRHVTAMLQRGQRRDEPERRAWQHSIDITLRYCEDIYARLGVLLRREDVRGESFYNDRLAPTIAQLRADLSPERAATKQANGDAWAECRDDRGAACVFLHKAGGEAMYKNPEGEPLPLIVQKSDGAFLYASTDLAAIRFRVADLPDGLAAQRILYVVGAPTKLHLEMVFATARLAGWVSSAVALEHVSFGQVLGEDRKLLRTRSGGAVKLRDLLDEGERRAYEAVFAKNAERTNDEERLGEEELRSIGRAVGIGAIKWFDLARDRNADYVFNWDTMLALQGSTAPYMMYAYARIRSIYRKAVEQIGSPDVYAPGTTLILVDPAERSLALRIARFADAIAVVSRELTPHVICGYLYDLAGDFMRFYEACPVLAAADDATRISRLRLCDLAARTLRAGLGLLGIGVLERM